MKLGIIVYSETGHTLQVVEEIKKAIQERGHQVVLTRLESDNIGGTRKLKNAPTIEPCDALLIASPVQGFQLALPMLQFLNEATLPKVPQVGILLTEYFKVKFLGGYLSLKQVKKSLPLVEQVLIGEEIVHWSSKKRAEQISKAVKVFSEGWNE